MKSLVTGGAGFIGSNLVDALINLGHEVVVIDNESSDCHDQFYWNEKASNHKLDMRDYENTRALYNEVDYVFHLAAESRIQPAIKNPIQAISVNAVGTVTVLQCSREAGVKRVIYSSTSSAYGNNPIPSIESYPDDCLNAYSISKTTGEKLCSMYTKLHGLNTVFFRYFNVYGERQPLKGQYAPVVGLFLKQFKEGMPLTIVGDGEQRREFTHVSDAVNANILAATLPDESISFGTLYNVGAGKNYSINELASMISDRVEYIPPRLAEVRMSLSDTSKIRTDFGWKSTIMLEKWIEENK
jgi:UDP-glucose 4-epimerase